VRRAWAALRARASLELYKCAVLTVIALLLCGLLWRSAPRPVTMERVRSQKIKGWAAKLPLVYVADGSIDVSNTVDVEVQNTVDVDVDQPLEVTGAVEIER